MYWLDSTKKYDDEVKYSSEISSSIVGISRTSWQKSTKEESLKAKLELTKISTNCMFLKKKRDQ